MIMIAMMRMSISIAHDSIDLNAQCAKDSFFFQKKNWIDRKSLGKTWKSYDAQWVQQTLKKKVDQKTGEFLNVCGTSSSNLLLWLFVVEHSKELVL